jgi:hypothetical protein
MKSKDEIDKFIKLVMQIEKILSEFDSLSKKKPDNALNKFKLELVNTVLRSANQIINKENKPFPNFDEFGEEEIPTNSDVVMILSQYVACLDKFRRENTIKNEDREWVWVIKGRVSRLPAPNPSYSILNV